MFIGEIHPRVQADVDPPGDHPQVDVRRHQAAIAADNRARLNGVKAPDAGGEIRAGTPPAAEARVDSFLLLTVVRMVIASCGVGLPDLQQHITDRCSGAVDNPAFNGDPLPGGIRGGEDRAKVFLKNMKARGVRRQTDMNIGSRRLRGGFRQILFHRAAP